MEYFWAVVEDANEDAGHDIVAVSVNHPIRRATLTVNRTGIVVTAILHRLDLEGRGQAVGFVTDSDPVFSAAEQTTGSLLEMACRIQRL